MKILKRKFYQRDPKNVAIELLGKLLIRKVKSIILSGIIVETEAYYGKNDPASRAYHGMKNYNKQMWDVPGTLFIYNVHKYWMLNIVVHKKNDCGAVLIRAIQPVDGIDVMKKNRKVVNLYNLTNGPGKLTQALKIDKSLNGLDVTKPESEIIVVNTGIKPKQIGQSHRIGVRRDLKEKLRFFIKGNKFVSC